MGWPRRGGEKGEGRRGEKEGGDGPSRGFMAKFRPRSSMWTVLAAENWGNLLQSISSLQVPRAPGTRGNRGEERGRGGGVDQRLGVGKMTGWKRESEKGQTP